jgi:phosphomevalonate kinase
VNVVAPGKLVLTGAYAVLEGAPAIVVAVDRYAVADVASQDLRTVDVASLHDEAGRKLGLGSSAASMVAMAGASAHARGEDLADPAVRAALFREVREAHARSQGGGSGVDVAAAVYGGALRYAVQPPDGAGPQVPSIRPVAVPSRIELRAFWSGASARTSELRARVDALRSRTGFALAPLRRLAAVAAAAVDGGDARAFVLAARDYGDALATLGHAADAPIVPPSFAKLARQAERADGAFLPSGAGGGDVAVWLGLASPPADFVERAAALGMRAIPLSIDVGGVRLHSPHDRSS